MMARRPLESLDGRNFDVVVVGAGINGTAAAQQLAGAGYAVLLVDKGDFGSGASGRSGRMLHCGLRYLAPGVSLADLVRNPTRLLAGVRMAREALGARDDFVTNTPERVRPFTFCMPIYDDAVYAGWQVDLAFKALQALNGPGGTPLDYRRLSAAEARSMPLLRALRDPEALQSAALFREYSFDWPERLCVDAALDAQRMGCILRNYTAVESLERAGDNGWNVELHDQLGANDVARVSAKVVLNMTGMWIDLTNRRVAGAAAPGRKVVGMKGTHILVRLPPDCAEYGLITVNRGGAPFFCMPAPGGLHYFGPTDARDDGDPDAVAPTEAEILFLLGEANHALPGLPLRRADVLGAWSGTCPYTFSPDLPKGKRSRDLHDLGKEGLPNLLALTGGSVRTHRLVGLDILREVRARVAPSGREQAPNFHVPPVSGAKDLRHAAKQEHVATLSDLLFRRSNLGWVDMSGPALPWRAASAVRDVLGWDERYCHEEVERYRAYLRHQHAVRLTAETGPGETA